ncbi:hypothetical protein FSOLCH5_001246 [Fusarium solani]|uniref:Uncharacterized protein n=1 Tax=Fusarium solani TaxID=169388 RepID=A0A9P9L4M6_FUSSL|nr:uncharacterized protein B0J15DRAFT_541815 [Fusarium solani]KAH7273881.1 hypothetical protein B0J15DRAFT_541815 [Fusarium solani]
MAGNNNIAAAQGNNDRPRIRIKLLPRGSRSSSASGSKSPSDDDQKVLETAAVLAAMKHQTIPEESSLTVSPVSANNSSSSPEQKPSKNPSPNNSSDNKKKKKPAATAKTKTSKRRNSDMSDNWPPCPITNSDPSGIALWRQGCEAVQRPDGSVDGLDVVNWMMTRRGGVANPWPRLEENRAAVRAMGRQRIDPLKILQQQEEEAEIARLKEERRQANKRRYRPRGQIAREKAERAAAAAAAEKAKEEAQEQAQKETSGANKRPLNDETEADNEEPQAKKARLDVAA